ncbi:(d)CMP kinase [Alphaproteobacteria bacterium]|jgi:cytidylate kinase|nr:(d)CMP kinase [Alphaproteobacteria bacterium]
MIEIAIDGTAASGKGTLARRLSVKYDFPHLDTGSMYRMVALELINDKKNDYTNLEIESCKIAKKLSFKQFENNKLRSEVVAALASKIASFPSLRETLNLKQIEFANVNKRKYGGCILDGRDIGTKILPNANFKFFINASVEIRAKRRLLEKNITFLHGNDEKCMLQSLINDITKRDLSDSTRKTSPLVPAEDAFIIDTSTISADEVMSIATKIIERSNKTVG